MRNRAWLAFAVVALMALAVVTAAADAARLDDSLAALRAQPDPGDRFTFVVVSDMHSAASPERTQALRMSMEEIRLLRPSLVVATGDLILGGGLDQLQREWRENLSDAALCGAPFFPVVGNHDVAGPETEAIWEAVNGPLRYSFDRGNCHFVILNSMEQGGVWGEAQLEWLKADLATAQAQHVFVFLHHPLWANEPERWDIVHQVLRRHPVRIVFTGHWHTYLKFDPMDGIQYVVLPSIGQTYDDHRDDATSGRFGGYLLVMVDGDQVSYAVVRAGNIFSPDVSLQRDVMERRRIQREYVQAPVVDYSYGDSADATVRLMVKNPYPEPLASSIIWEVTDPRWQVTPLSRDYEVPAQGEVSLEFRVRVSDPAALEYPTPTFTTEYHYGPEQEKSVTVRGRAELRPSLPVVRTRRPIAVDGKLDEWADVLAMPLGYASRISIDDVENLSAKVQFQWDEDYIYMAVTVRDNVFYQPYSGDGAWQADNLQLFFDPKGDGNGPGHREDDYAYGMTLTARGVQPWVWRSPDLYEGEAADIKLAVERTGDLTIYEAAIPASRLAPARLAAGTRMGYNLVVNDKDGPVVGQRHWWVELLPGAGTGGTPFPLVNLVLQ